MTGNTDTHLLVTDTLKMSLGISSHRCIHAIGKMQLCLLSQGYACPYHNPTTPKEHTVQNGDIRKPPTHTTPYTWAAVVSPIGRTAKFSKTMLDAAHGREMNIKLSSNSSGGHSCIQRANCTLLQNLRHLWHCYV